MGDFIRAAVWWMAVAVVIGLIAFIAIYLAAREPGGFDILHVPLYILGVIVAMLIIIGSLILMAGGGGEWPGDKKRR